MIRPNDCLRAAVAMVIDIHPSRLRYIDSSAKNVDFWNDWTKLLWEKGYKWFHLSPDKLPPTDGLWVACVPSLTGAWTGRHAVVMLGDKLWHDPSNVKPRVRTPRKFFEGYHIVPRDDAAAARGPIAV